MPASPPKKKSGMTSEEAQVDAQSPAVLKDEGNKAFAAGDDLRAARMYTLGIDLCFEAAARAKKVPTSPAEWFAADRASGGMLHMLLSNRSMVMLKQEDFAAAAEDAEHCCKAKPDFVKGHLRLLAALKANGASLPERMEAADRARRACPGSKPIRDAKAELSVEAGEGEPEDDAAGAGGGATRGAAAAAAAAAAGSSTTGKDGDASVLAAAMAATRRAADDASDPRHALAAGDLGSALAVGAHGLSKDVKEAERYLRLGSEGGDAGSQRNYGLLLLEQGRSVKAAEQLHKAAQQGDDEATAVLTRLGEEAKEKRKEAMKQLRVMAEQGDPRAVAMLKQLEEQEGEA